MLTVGPEIPAPLRPLLLELVDAVRELQSPTQPHTIFACLQAALPPAARFNGAAARVADLDILVLSNGTNWIRQDTGDAL